MPLAKRYGAALLCLPLSSGDLPEKAEDRVALAESIVNRAYGYGLQPHDLLLDPLVLTLASGEIVHVKHCVHYSYIKRNLASQQ